MGIRKRHVNEFPTPYTCTAAIREGGMETKLSMVLMGLEISCINRRSKD